MRNKNQNPRKKNSQLKSVGLAIVSKIDNILEDYKLQGPLIPKNNDLSSGQLNVLQKEKDDLPIIIPKNNGSKFLNLSLVFFIFTFLF